jgi:hypothetical protein
MLAEQFDAAITSSAHGGAAVPGVEHVAFARSRRVDTWLAALARLAFSTNCASAASRSSALSDTSAIAIATSRSSSVNPNCSISRWIFSELGPNFCFMEFRDPRSWGCHTARNPG